MKVVSLFSGIGGIDLGLVNAGHEIILQVENNPHCIQVLKANFPATAIVFDIVTLQTLPLDTDIVVAGFPCQDVSTENQYRPGIEKGLRSGLVSHVFRLLKNKKVPWVIFENVPGLLNWHWNQDPPQQPGIAYITRELDQLGYRWAYRIVDLASFGIPHSRARVFIVASIHGDPRDILLSQNPRCQGQCSKIFQDESVECYECSSQQPSLPCPNTTACIDLGEKRHPPYLNILHCLTTANGRRTCIVRNMQDGDEDSNKICTMLDIRDAERLLGFPEGWTSSCYPLIESDKASSHKIDYKIQTQKRLSVLGNSCAVPMFFWIGQQLNEPYVSKFLLGSLGEPFLKECPGSQDDSAWPRCAWNISPKLFWQGRYGISGITSAPQIHPYTMLGNFLRYGNVVPKLMLCQKFLMRLKKRGFELSDFVVNGMLAKSNGPGEMQGLLLTPEDLNASGDTSNSDESQDNFEKVFDHSNLKSDMENYTEENILLASYKLRNANVSVMWPAVSIRSKNQNFHKIKTSVSSIAHDEGDLHLVLLGLDSVSFLAKEIDCREFFSSYAHARTQSILSTQKENYIIAIDQALSKFRVKNLEYFDMSEQEISTDLKKLNPCGHCKICLRANKRISDTTRRNPQKFPRLQMTPIEQQTKKKLSGLSSGSCPRVLSTRLAQQGHQGAIIALQQNAAVGNRVKILWSYDNEFFCGTVTRFNPLTFTHSITYDDGDEDIDLKLWQETVISI